MESATKQNSELREQYFKLSEFVQAQVRALSDEIDEVERERSSNNKFHESYLLKIDTELDIIEKESLEGFHADSKPIENKIHQNNLETEYFKEEIRALKVKFEHIGKEIVESVVYTEKSVREQTLAEHAVQMS